MSGSPVPQDQKQDQEPRAAPTSSAGLEPGQLLGQPHQPSSDPEVALAANASRRPGNSAGQGAAAEVDRPEYADPSTQPAVRFEDLPREFQEILKDDLSIESLPPEHRQLILNYFRNLRAASTGPTVRP